MILESLTHPIKIDAFEREENNDSERIDREIFQFFFHRHNDDHKGLVYFSTIFYEFHSLRVCKTAHGIELAQTQIQE